MEENKEKEMQEKQTQKNADVSQVASQDVVDRNEVKEDVQVQQLPMKNSVKKRFEVEIYDKISVGEPPYEQIQLQKVNFEKPVIIEAATKKDLQDFGEKLALCQQTFKIVKVLDDIPLPSQLQNNIQQPSEDLSKTQYVQQAQAPIVKRKPRFYKIGNIEIKDDNGKIYQKQWLKLTDEEMSNFRIVNNKTNAIVTLKDRSIEMKKWVLVETTEDATTDLEENMK